MLLYEEANNLLSYDALTGELRWRVRRGGTAKAGSIAGTLDGHGHRQVRVNGRLYMAHHVAWLLHAGVWPAFEIDHKNNDRDDNRFVNFRPATKGQNNCNRLLNANSSSGLKGAHFEKKSGKWRGQIRHNKKAVFLGYFKSAQDAHAAYCSASVKLHGSFGRTS